MCRRAYFSFYYNTVATFTAETENKLRSRSLALSSSCDVISSAARLTTVASGGLIKVFVYLCLKLSRYTPLCDDF